MSEPLLPSTQVVRCVHCLKAIDAEDTHCRHCGRPQRIGGAWYYSPLWIAAIAFLALGPLAPFALILLWKSTRMGPGAKCILAALILAYTIVTWYYTYIAYAIFLDLYSDFREVLEGI